MLKLTEPQIRHLTELVELGRYAAWHPRNSGEKRCARVLTGYGLLDRGFYGNTAFYTLTDAGSQRANDELAKGYEAVRS